MIFLTGDTHGDIDIGKLKPEHFPAGDHLQKSDYVIILGDFGFIWDPVESENERTWLNWLEECPWTTLFLDGNHENFGRLTTFPIEQWHGGTVQRIRSSVIHLMRGQIYDIEGLSFFVMGGARSSDINQQRKGISWWPEEEPSQNEYQEAFRNLEEHNCQVDVILTHELPTKQLKELAPYQDAYELTDFLNSVRKGVEYQKWYCGHHHVDKGLSENIWVMYDDIIALE